MTRGINDEAPRGGGHRGRGSDKGVVVAQSAQCVRVTDKALLVFVEKGPPEQQTLPGFKARDPKPHAGEEVWVPRSQVHEDSEVYEADTVGRLVVTAWFASKEGWG